MPPSDTLRLALAALLGTIALPTTAEACSKAFRPFRSAATAAFLGTASADTVLAGAGPVRYTMEDGHHGSGYGQARPVHGQVVAIERMDARTRAMLPAGTTRVVIVPWDYAADCKPTLWANSFRWAAPGAAGLFVAELRDRADWAGDVPTLDVHEPSWFPYPGRMRALRRHDGYLTPLTAEELLGLYEVMPTHEERERDLAAAIAPAIAWARRHPDLARREPAASALRSLRHEEEQRRVQAIDSPLAGTWRLDLSLGDSAPRTLWVRTVGRPAIGELARRTTPADVAPDPLAPHHSVAYIMELAGATTLAGLPAAAEPHRIERIGKLRVELPGGTDPTASAWHGAVEIALLERVFAADPWLRYFARSGIEVYDQRRRAGLAQPTQATFTRAVDGAIRVEHHAKLSDGRTLRIRGVRVSDAVIRDAPPGR